MAAHILAFTVACGGAENYETSPTEAIPPESDATVGLAARSRRTLAEAQKLSREWKPTKSSPALMTVKDALDDVEIAFRQLEFSIKLLSFCELGNITPSDFDTDHIVILGSERLNFPSGKFVDLDSIIKAAGTSVLIAFSASVLALDDAFQAAGMKPCPEAVGASFER